MVTVSYQSTDGTATSPGDFGDAAGTLTFAPGVTSQTISVDSTGDLLDEDDETFTIALSAPQGAVLGTAIGTVTITDDDAPPTLAVAAASANEGAAGIGFAVTLSAPSGKPVTVAYATTDGTAAAADYTATTGTASCRDSAATSVSSATSFRSTSARPSGPPRRRCSTSAARSPSSSISPASIRISPIRLRAIGCSATRG